jgi:hypothetical protein
VIIWLWQRNYGLEFTDAELRKVNNYAELVTWKASHLVAVDCVDVTPTLQAVKRMRKYANLLMI